MNIQNVLVRREDVESILNFYGPIGDDHTNLTVKDILNYQKAFVHESYYIASKNISNMGDINGSDLYLPDESNERLEFLGDNALKYAMGRYLFERFPDEREGFMTKMKIKMEQTKTLHKFAKDLNFSKFLLLSEEVEAQAILGPDLGRNTRKFYEDAFEAFIGSIILDNGERGVIYANRFSVNVIENTIDFSELITKNDNFKDSLQKFYQKSKWNTPEYKELSAVGPSYRRIFTRVLWIKKDWLVDSLEMYIPQLKIYTEKSLMNYKDDKELYKKFYDKYYEEECFLLGVGSGRKVIDAEQECAKESLLNLGISLNF